MDEICTLNKVLQKEKRKQLIENSQSLFTQTNNTQTPPVLQLHYKFVPILQDLLGVINHRTKLNLEMITAWMIRTRGEEGGWHNHLRCTVSGTFYLRTNPKVGIKFLRPDHEQRMHCGPGTGEYGTLDVELFPEPGEMYVWPSYVMHMVDTQREPGRSALSLYFPAHGKRQSTIILTRVRRVG